MVPRCAAAFVVCCFLGFTQSARGATVVLPAQADTTLRELAPNEINGTVQSLRVGTLGANGMNLRQRGLFQFDVAGVVPPGAIITSARLRLTVAQAPDSTASPPIDYQLHRLLTNWNEAAATWLERDAGEPWSIPGGTNGVDCVPTASAVTPLAGPDQYTCDPTPQLVADVQGWLDSPVSNFGWMLRQSDETIPRSARRISSTESPTGEPLLEISYTEPLRIGSTALVNGQFCLTFTARVGRIYRIEHRALVNTGTWSMLVTLPPAQVESPVTICVSMSGIQRFYRLADVTP